MRETWVQSGNKIKHGKKYLHRLYYDLDVFTKSYDRIIYP